jgi:hypothetical protein
MGSSVIVGIASTKLIGVIVLAFAPSTLFRLYYFRMYIFIIIIGVFNGLMFLPIVLSFIGPEADQLLIAEKEMDEVKMLKEDAALGNKNTKQTKYIDEGAYNAPEPLLEMEIEIK